MSKKTLFAVGIVLLAGLAVLTGCQGSAPAKAQTTVQVAARVADEPSPGLSDEERTLASLQKVDNYPLYVMTYYGDYGFGDMLEDEGVPTTAAAAMYDAWACTTFAAQTPDGDTILGRNFDWRNRPALLLFTDPPDGYASASMVDISYLGIGVEKPTKAKLRNLLEAPYWPFDGMNEAGLAVGMMAVSHAEGGSDPQKATLDSLAAIRLLLDYAANVDEAIALLQSINVDFGGGPPLHYLIADSSGDSAVIEFVDDEPVVLRTDEPWQVSTNFVISEVPEDERTTVCDRYQTVSQTLERAHGQITEGEAMSLLSEVSSNSPQTPTMWSVVYNMTTGEIQVVVGRRYDTAYAFQLDKAAD